MGHFPHGGDHGRNLSLVHGGINRQGEGSAVLRLGLRKIAGLVAEALLVKGLEVQGDEMDAGADSAPLQLHQKLIATDRKLPETEPSNDRSGTFLSLKPK